MNHIQDIIQRLQLGGIERRIAQNMNISRATVHKHHKIAKGKYYLQKSGASRWRSRHWGPLSGIGGNKPKA